MPVWGFPNSLIFCGKAAHQERKDALCAWNDFKKENTHRHDPGGIFIQGHHIYNQIKTTEKVLREEKAIQRIIFHLI